jgi:hypothetical protein
MRGVQESGNRRAGQGNLAVSFPKSVHTAPQFEKATGFPEPVQRGPDIGSRLGKVRNHYIHFCIKLWLHRE